MKVFSLFLLGKICSRIVGVNVPPSESKEIDTLSYAAPSLQNEILHFAAYTAVGYCSKAERDGANQNTNMLPKTTVEYYEIYESSTRVLIYVDSTEGSIVTIFQCDGNLSNFINLYSKAVSKYPEVNKARVNQKSLVSAQELRYQIFDKLALLTQKFPNYQLVLVGHSLGGNVAILAAPMLATDLRSAPKPSESSPITNQEWGTYSLPSTITS